MMKTLRVNVISESAFTVKGHGVHTAFTEMVDALEANPDVEVVANSRQSADIVHIHTVGAYSLYKLLFSGGAKVISAHVMPDSFVGSLIGAKYWYGLAGWYLRWFYNQADAILAVSQEVADQLKAIGVSKPVFVVPNTIKSSKYVNNDQDREGSRSKLGYKSDDFIIIGVGQVQPRKRIDTFVAVAKALPDYKFIWVGGIPFKHAAADYAKMKKLMDKAPDNVVFAGEVDHKSISQYYAASDLFFLPSSQETFGIVIAEAAASGLPVLLRDLDQYKITFNGNYAAGDDKTFTSEIKKIKENNQYRQGLIQKSQHIAEMYDSDKATGRLIHIYKEVIQKKKS